MSDSDPKRLTITFDGETVFDGLVGEMEMHQDIHFPDPLDILGIHPPPPSTVTLRGVLA